MKRKMIFLKAFYAEIAGKELERENFISQVLRDGGVDMEYIPRNIIGELFDATYTGDYEDVSWGFDETTAGYLFDFPASIDQLSRIIFAMFVVCNAAERGKLDWGLIFNKQFTIFSKVYEQLETLDSLQLLPLCFNTSSIDQLIENTGGFKIWTDARLFEAYSNIK